MNIASGVDVEEGTGTIGDGFVGLGLDRGGQGGQEIAGINVEVKNNNDKNDKNDDLAKLVSSSKSKSDSNLSNLSAAIEVKRMADEAQELQWIVQQVKKKMYPDLHSPSSRHASASTSTSTGTSTGSRGNDKSNSNNHDKDKDKDNSQYNIVILTRSHAELKKVVAALVADRVPFRSQNYGDMWVLPAGNVGGAMLSLLRLVADPSDDVAFELALDNDLLLSYSTIDQNNLNNVNRGKSGNSGGRRLMPGAFDPHSIRDVDEVRQVVLPILREVQREQRENVEYFHRPSSTGNSNSGDSGNNGGGLGGMTLLEAAREAVLTNRLPHRKYTGAVKSFLLHVTRWADEADRGRSYSGERSSVGSSNSNSATGSATTTLVQDILEIGYAQRIKINNLDLNDSDFSFSSAVRKS